MLKTLLAVLMVAPPPLPPERTQDLPSETEASPESTVSDPEALAEARSLFRQGGTKYDAADFNGAIADFTKALGIVVSLPEDNEEIRLTLLYNIAAAHEKAFEIDRDVTHLRQALQLYKRYKAFAQERGTLNDIFDVEAKIEPLEKRIRAADLQLANREAQEESKSVPPPPPPTADWKKPRNVGIGLTVSGGAALVGGVVLTISGSRYRPNAQEQVMKLGDLGIPMDHPAWQEGERFIDDETRKGNILMGVGGAVATLGAVGTGVGVYFLVKSGKLRNGIVQPSATLTPTYAGFSLTGRF